MSINEAKLNEFLGKFVNEIGACAAGANVVLGHRLGLYKALSQAGAVTSAELAKKTEMNERYVREWLSGQAAGGWIEYDAGSEKFSMNAEQAFMLADESSPAFVPGAFLLAQAMYVAIPRMEDNFRTGKGLPWGEHHECLFAGTESFFRSSYIGNLLSGWIPALDGVKEKLERGAKVADVGCGLGASTIILAKAFPRSTFIGIDSHEGSIVTARERARAAGVGDQVKFEVAKSTDFPGDGYDLIANFDCLHDMEDPVGAARYARQKLAADGTWMIVEPMANDSLKDNLNPVGRLFYAASTMLCVPHSLSQNGPALGAQAGEARLRDVATKGGFSRFRRASETPFNMVLEARP
ncbi:MAG TPA: class I SAM-dependent methyltransferase [Kofleriaceae bacterium]|nr:class I SAM-dependent methyltransferase [Kofleriaceae bacterium]